VDSMKTGTMKALSRDVPVVRMLDLRWIAIAAFVLHALLAVAPLSAQSRSDVQRRVVKQVAPTYPEIAKSMRIHGTVKVALRVAPNGSIVSAEVLGGHPLLAKAAIDAVRQWRYETRSQHTSEVVAVEFTP